MRAVRIFAWIALLTAGLAVSAHAQYSNATGTFPAKIGVVTGALPDAGLSLPAELQNVGPDLYVGEVTVSSGPGGYAVRFKGERADGAKLSISARFSPDWAGLKFGSLVVGSENVSDVITGDDVAHLLSARIRGCGTVGGETKRVFATIGAGGVVEKFRILKCSSVKDDDGDLD